MSREYEAWKTIFAQQNKEYRLMWDFDSGNLDEPAILDLTLRDKKDRVILNGTLTGNEALATMEKIMLLSQK